MSLKEHVERYVALKRRLGLDYRNNERLLLSWADTAMACGEDMIRANTMIQWAEKTPSDTWARRRLGIGRQFAIWLHAEDKRHEIPHLESLGRSQERRRVPYLLDDSQIRLLMEAALQLPPVGSITPHTMHCIIGLIAVTGLRRSEACALRLSDITADGLVIRQTKFSKTRLVTVSESTLDALHRYLGARKKRGGPSDRLFVLSTGRPINPDILTGMFIKLARTTGLRGGKREPGVAILDLRHRFAVKSLEQAIATDRASVSRHILALSTYLGHVNVSSTYWYLEATPVLLRQIAQTTEVAHSGRAPS